MVKCYFCLKTETESYWSYYCKDCIKIKQFCKAFGSEKLVKSIHFKINEDTLNKIINEDDTYDPPMTRSRDKKSK